MRKVIFVDDDEEDMFLFDKAMNYLNKEADIYYAVCGQDLFYLLNFHEPELLFLDIRLPDLSGLECLKMVRQMPKCSSVPVIMYSVFSQQQMIDDCYKEKANYFLIKPGKFEILVDLLKKTISIDWSNQPYPVREKFIIQ